MASARLKRLRALLRKRMRIDPQSWRGAAWTLRATAIGVLVAMTIVLAIPVLAFERTLGIVVAVLIACAMALVAIVIAEILRRLPRVVLRSALFLAAVLVTYFVYSIPPWPLLAMLASTVLAVGVLGGSIASLRAGGWRFWSALGAALSGVAIAGGLLAYGVPGWTVAPAERPLPAAAPPLSIPDPSEVGSYDVATLTYGSGKDRHRPEFADKADLQTTSVDGSRLIDGWDGPAGWARTRYWGFDATALPLQGRVWMPRRTESSPNDDTQAHERYPLVLIVHGNHDMEDYSDGGYAYLAQLFASRGFIAVSVDENFLNGSFADLLSGPDGGLETENDARGWLLLQHLDQIRRWNSEPGNPFFERVDTDRVVLIGHSRGGEAVAEAAVFNRLARYPDDARVELPLPFGIRGLIAIAPSDGQYDPRGLDTRPRGVSYLVVQGSLDGDVQSFAGAAQYARLAVASCTSCFKTAVYVVGANHGQFNTSWGRDDLGPPGGGLLNLTPIMPPQEQRHLAQVLFSAFLETVLHDDLRYRTLFVDPERGRRWLRATELIARFEDGADELIAGFEEDDDVTTGTAAGVRIDGTNLARWGEEEVALKDDDLDSVAVLLGWTKSSTPAQYNVRFDTPRAFAEDRALAFDAAMSEESPYDANDDGESARDWTTPESIDFDVEIVDVAGERARIAISEIAALAPPVSSATRKASWLDSLDESEPVFRRYGIAASALHAKNPSLELGRVAGVSFVFDATPAGAILLDNVAISRAE